MFGNYDGEITGKCSSVLLVPPCLLWHTACVFHLFRIPFSVKPGGATKNIPHSRPPYFRNFILPLPTTRIMLQHEGAQNTNRSFPYDTSLRRFFVPYRYGVHDVRIHTVVDTELHRRTTPSIGFKELAQAPAEFFHS